MYRCRWICNNQLTWKRSQYDWNASLEKCCNFYPNNLKSTYCYCHQMHIQYRNQWLTSNKTRINNTLVSENAGNEKNLHPGGRKKFFSSIEFLESLHLKNYSNSTFPRWKTKSPIFYCLKGKKRNFVRINLLVEIFLFVRDFLKQKYIFLYAFSLWGRVGDKTRLSRSTGQFLTYSRVLNNRRGWNNSRGGGWTLQ